MPFANQNEMPFAAQNLMPFVANNEMPFTANSAQPLRLFVSGTAGVGKSFLIKMISKRLTLNYTNPATRAIKPAVLLAAPTGIAAIQINGSTLHNLFSLEVQQGRDSAFKPLNSVKLNAKKILFSNLQLLIIDEISMCSNIMLAKIHKRLTEVKENNGLFGNVNVVVFGDLLQLPSINSPYIFEVYFLNK